ncbi:hypothetical protein [Pseudoalteromonas sp. MEBiC 03485]|uniref:hypothetical protein n=1 Tax=Pseudoalteromonas sp. MEBiC 03485 TaxID=2571103 RepID=UPI00101FF54D|nr:hypothetical protein [Pseudoalteromonas sp. MEBiC 03485]RZD22403.1 hypothetical protein EVU92_10190 [Pseudoalteromonas sp. MEBiC 03485]
MAFTAESVSILNGQDVVDVNSAESIENIKAGDFLQIGSFPLVEIKQAYKNGQGQKFIQLTKAWELTTQSNQPAIVIPTSGEFRAAVKALQDANILVNDNQQALQDYQNNLGTVTFKKSDGTTTTVKTLKQIEADNQAQMNAYHPNPWAMRKVEFEAMRAANEEKYAASGFVHFGKHYLSSNTSVSINEGLWTITTQPDALRLGRDGGSGESENDFAAIVIAGVITELKELSIVDTKIKLPPAEDGTRTYDSATGISTTHATSALAFAAETATNKVVTDRVDMWGFEAFLREINDNDPFVYKKGLPQSLATEINGVPTVSDNVRAVTYFAWYEGDTTSGGKGVNWQTATEAQRIAIASDPENNIYFDDATGKFYQWCVRGRSFAGAGNGDWPFIDSSKSSGLVFSITPLKIIPNQGILDIVPDATLNNYYIPAAHSYSMHTDVGAYRATRGSQKNVTNAVNGECYFLVCGTIERLNQGAYHPSHNRFGSAKLTSDGSNYQFWYEYTGSEITDQLSVFENTRVNTGAIEQESGRPDGRYYDAIYASGQGGVCRDMRYSAHKLTAKDFAKEDLKIKSGEYRGREALSITKFYAGNVGGNTVSNGWQLRTYDGAGVSATGVNIALNTNTPVFAESLKYGRVFAVTDGVNSLVLKVTGVLVTNVYSLTVLDEIGSFPIVSSDSGQDSSSLSILIDVKHNVSVAGEYTHTEVIGDPAKIMLCDDLKNGWVGSWNSFIPDGSALWSSMKLSKPTEVTSLNRAYTNDNGLTWSTTGIAIDPVTNASSVNDAPAIGRVEIWQYKTKANMTQSVSNLAIYGGDIGNVFYSQGWREWTGRHLGYSLTGEINTSIGAGTNKFFQTVKLESYSLYEGKLGAWTSTNRGSPTHVLPKDFNAPENEGPAFKALNYNVAKNQQGFINYAYAELTYDATAGDWGDDGKIHIVDNQTTMLDENGHTNLVGMACCVEPLGWV